jgi:hypothetical protein
LEKSAKKYNEVLYPICCMMSLCNFITWELLLGLKIWLPVYS